MMTEKSPIIPCNFYCEKCDYNTSNKKDYNKHKLTSKHKLNDVLMTNDDANIPKYPQTYMCVCGKEYKYRQGLHFHKKTCNYQPLSENSNYNPPIEIYNQQSIDIQNKHHELILELIKDNKEIKDFMCEQNRQVIELAKLAGHNTTHTNSHNTNKFNINFFLNEKCKDALNITDFVSQLEVGIKDLEETGRLGFSEGISKIFINGLNQIELYRRPLHCNDAKRETLYIKDDNKWIKENEAKPILTKAIKEVAHKNIKKISDWQKNHKEYSDPYSKQNDKYLKIVCESMSGGTKEESEKNYEKIIKNLVKESIIPNTEK